MFSVSSLACTGENYSYMLQFRFDIQQHWDTAYKGHFTLIIPCLFVNPLKPKQLSRFELQPPWRVDQD